MDNEPDPPAGDRHRLVRITATDHLYGLVKRRLEDGMVSVEVVVGEWMIVPVQADELRRFGDPA